VLIDEIDKLLREAMKKKDLRTADVLRMLKTRVTERRTSPGFTGEVTDAIVQEVAATYTRQLEKALPEYERAGARGAEMVASLRFEIDYCRRFLPQKLGADETRALVQAAIGELSANQPRDAGRVTGHVVKAQRDRVDPALVKKLAEEALAAK
jgi:uncharacterized protein